MSSRTLPGALLLTLLLILVGPRPATAAILTVTSCADSGPTTLRGQVASASAGDTILLPACTITLATPVTIGTSLTLTGEGAARTAVSGGGVTQVLVVNGGIVVTIAGVTIRDGKANAANGGGIVNNGTLTLIETVVTANQTSNGFGSGGGIFSSGPLTLVNSTVSGNTAVDFGGGLYNNTGPLTLLNSTVSGNMAASGGGIGSTDTLMLRNSTVSGNTAGRGGGIDNHAPLTLLNSTVSGNTATSSIGFVGGGGIWNNGGPLTLLNSTVSGNTTAASVGGGGLRNFAGVVALKNTIVAHNTAPTGGDCSGAVSSQGHDLDSDGSCSFAATGDLSGVDPKLGPLQDNGGPTQTQALLAGSPAIDAGDPVGCPPTDQRGTARPQDGDGSGPAVCDIGAYELVFVPPPPPPNPLTISPPSGVLVTTQGFDLVLTIDAPGRLIVGGQAIFDGADVTLALLQCLHQGTLLAGGLTFRCPGLHGGLLPPGTHTFSVIVDFNTGSPASDTATWEVEANTEP